jgi:hypothetical protein
MIEHIALGRGYKHAHVCVVVVVVVVLLIVVWLHRSVSDESIVSKYIMQPYWNFCIRFVPGFLAPNLGMNACDSSI